MVIVLMGVAGSGKTTVGRELARELGWEFRDGDEFHPAANVAKMAAGIPLGDGDREPWLAAIGAYVDGRRAAGKSAVVACSALKEAYRLRIVPDPSRVSLVWLTGDPELLRRRIRGREGHFMKEDMLASQLEALEPPANALRIDVDATPAELVGRIRAELGI